MRKKIIISLLLMVTTVLFGQKYQYPFAALRTNKSYSLNSVEVLKDKIKVEVEFLGSYLYEGISVPPTIKIITATGERADLLNTGNVSISPKITNVATGNTHIFTLYFKKLENLEKKRFSIYSDENSLIDMYFFDIELNKGVTKKSESQVSKSDHFLRLIPVELMPLYYFEHFISSPKDVRVQFDEIIEAQVNGNLRHIKKIDSEEIDFMGKPADAYTINTDAVDAKISSYYIKKDEPGDRINSIMIYFSDLDEAKKFLDSIAEWYGASHKKGESSALLFHLAKPRIVLFNITDRDFVHTVDIHVLTDDEYTELKKSRASQNN